GRSARGEEVFQLLERLAGGAGPVAERALKGLRWLDTPAGWELVRRRAGDHTAPFRTTAAELLRFAHQSATRELLLRLVTDDPDYRVSAAALASARRLWGRESLEPDYAHVQRTLPRTEVLFQESVKRACENGDARRLFEILPRCRPEVQD